MLNTSSRQYMWIFFCILILSLAFTAAVHRCADRWGIFTADYRHFVYGSVPNRHFLKTKYVLENRSEIDCILFGSSKVSTIDARQLGPKCYNFTFAGAVPSHYLHVLKILIREDVKLERVYISLDDISYTWDPSESVEQYLRRPYPDNAWAWLKFYAFYLIKPIKERDLMTVYMAIAGYDYIIEMSELIADPNEWVEKRRDFSNKIFAEPQAQDEKIKSSGPIILGKSLLLEEALEDLHKISRLAEDRGIKATFFFNPHHYKTYLARDMAAMAAFKRGVANIQPFTDFSGINDVTSNNRYWLDTSHYSILIGDAMIQVLSGGRSGFEYFERRVSRETIEQHLENEYQQMAQSLVNLMVIEDRITFPAEAVRHIPSDKRRTLVRQPALNAADALSSDAVRLQNNAVGALSVETFEGQQFVQLSGLPVEPGHFYLVSMEITAAEKGLLKIYFEDTSMTLLERQPVHAVLKKGTNTLYMPVYDSHLGARLRIQTADAPYRFLVSALRIDELLL